ncbi:hypothetical protein HanHA300_Chr09g0306701 [Helianthus annuus]|nr:hypothetical protein HanHA300_Chr09g0306701 [Helianthus annuus]KAJ0541342.1 hypothetical protein HanHA89_Chr09g0327311 [Helianthus annuus]KAJ0706422.1 hypothetical protein HanLR1_Chr09g0306791 [Helianthus annuus]KAJ0710460.1 hypothetical protein HanOQP8_Chr09g0312631 [Helianthus annuus]
MNIGVVYILSLFLYLKPGLGLVFIAEEWRRMMMDGLTTCCPFSGVSGSSVMEVTPRQSIAYVALTGNCHWCHLHCGVSTTCLST